MAVDQVLKSKKIVEKNLYMVISTSSKDARPWISPVFFAHDEDYNIYWASAENAKHSTLIKENPAVSAVIFDSTAPYGMGDGVYMAGKAEELSDGGQIEHGILLREQKKSVTGSLSNKLRIRTKDDFLPPSPWRMYKFVPEEFWTLKEPVVIEGFPSDLKDEIDLRG